MNDHIDMGERRFSYRITADRDIARQAQIFNEAPRTLSFFPSGAGVQQGSAVVLDDPGVILSSVRGESMVLHNTLERLAEVTLTLRGKDPQRLTFRPFELKIL